MRRDHGQIKAFAKAAGDLHAAMSWLQPRRFREISGVRLKDVLAAVVHGVLRS